MTDNFAQIDVDSDEYLDAPKALRDAYKKLQDRYGTVTQERDTLKNQVTASALSSVLTGFKNPERVKRDLLADGIDPLDSSAVQGWLGENGDDYAKGGEAPAPDPNAEAAQAQQAFTAGTEFRQPASMSKVEAATAEITPDMTPEQIIEVYRKHGV